MAFGVAKTLGYDLVKLDSRIFRKANEYWQRWDIGVFWLRVYLYIPLVETEKGNAQKIHLMLTCYLGFWHAQIADGFLGYFTAGLCVHKTFCEQEKLRGYICKIRLQEVGFSGFHDPGLYLFTCLVGCFSAHSLFGCDCDFNKNRYECKRHTVLIISIIRFCCDN
jgi:hypothetical protein